MNDRARGIMAAARETLARPAHVEPGPLALALAREIEHPTDRDRREIAAQEAKRAAQREQEAERKRLAETLPADDVQLALEACARAISDLGQENTGLREAVADLTRRLDALEQRPVDNLTGIERGLDRIDTLADKLERTLQRSFEHFDDRPLPHLSS